MITQCKNAEFYQQNIKGVKLNHKEIEHRRYVDGIWFIHLILSVLSLTRCSQGGSSDFFFPIPFPHLCVLIVSNGIPFFPSAFCHFCFTLVVYLSQTHPEVHFCIYLIWSVTSIHHPFTLLLHIAKLFFIYSIFYLRNEYLFRPSLCPPVTRLQRSVCSTGHLPSVPV